MMASDILISYAPISIVYMSTVVRGYIVRPVMRDWAVLSKDTPLDISI